MNYSPKIYSGDHFSQIFSEVLEKNATVEKGLVRVLDNIKNKQNVTTLSGELAVQPYMVTPTGGTDTINFADATVEPVKKMVYTEFTYEDIRSTRFSADMKAGAANIESNEYLQNVLAYAIPKVGKGVEKDFWNNTLGKLSGATGVLRVTGTTLTASNVAAEFAKIYALIPNAILSEPELKIFADDSVKKFIMQANLNATYRDIFTVVGNDHFYLNIKIEYVPLGANKLAAGIASDFIWACDLLSDMGSFEVNRVSNNSDKWFLKSVFTLDAAVCIPSQKVIYI